MDYMHALKRDFDIHAACNMTVQQVQVCWEMQWPPPSHDFWLRWECFHDQKSSRSRD